MRKKFRLSKRNREFVEDMYLEGTPDIRRQLGSFAATVVRDTIKHSSIDLDFLEEEPAIVVSDPDSYCERVVPLKAYFAEKLRDERFHMAYYGDFEGSRNYRFYAHMTKALKEFMEQEKKHDE